jgi:hypothetical protein
MNGRAALLIDETYPDRRYRMGTAERTTRPELKK